MLHGICKSLFIRHFCCHSRVPTSPWILEKSLNFRLFFPWLEKSSDSENDAKCPCNFGKNLLKSLNFGKNLQKPLNFAYVLKKHFCINWLHCKKTFILTEAVVKNVLENCPKILEMSWNFWVPGNCVWTLHQ